MKTVLFIGNCGYKYNTVGGEITKIRLVYEYLRSRNARIKLIDLYWEKENLWSSIWGKVYLVFLTILIPACAPKSDMIFVGNQYTPIEN